MKLIFAGTPEIAKIVLQKLVENNYNVELVLTQPDRPAGRKLKLTTSPVKELAIERNIEVFQPVNFKANSEAIEKITSINADLMIVVAYGLILSPTILNIPKLGCINMHVSLLPKWRGAAPIQRAVLAGDSQTGITIMQMDAGLDTGDILLSKEMPIHVTDTSGLLHDKLANLGGEMVIEFLRNYKNIQPLKQLSDGVSYAQKITKQEALINWKEPAYIIARKVRGYNPYPGSFSYLNGAIYKIWQVKELATNSSKPAGSILYDGKLLQVVCGDGKILNIEEMQKAGGKRLAAWQVIQPDIYNQHFD